MRAVQKVKFEPVGEKKILKFGISWVLFIIVDRLTDQKLQRQNR